MSRPIALFALLCMAGLATAQELIPWRTDPAQAVREAQVSKRPLMVYVRAALKDVDDNAKHAHRQAFDDPGVVRLAQQFVPLRLSRSQHREVLPDFGLASEANMSMSFVTPDGTKLGEIDSSGIGSIPTLRQRMRDVIVAYGKKIFEDEVKPVFEKEDAKPNELTAGLKTVAALNVTSADADVIKLLERPRLGAPVQRSAYDALAVLSTKAAIEKLLALAQAGDAQAAQALERCTPAGAALLLPELAADAETFPYGIYEIVTKVCKIDKAKPERWFERAEQKLKDEEVARVKQLVEQVAQQWKQMNEEAR